MPERKEKIELCKPCAIGAEASGKAIRPLPGRCAKITCAMCGRRRYGLKYEIREDGKTDVAN